MSKHSDEVEVGERFEFGANWAMFLRKLDDARIDGSGAFAFADARSGFARGQTLPGYWLRKWLVQPGGAPARRRGHVV